MTPEQEKKLLQAMYDRLFDLITYQPTGGKNPFTADETFVHFAKFGALSPSSFHDAKSPSNPAGDLAAAETFSRMVDVVSPLSIEWSSIGASLSTVYKNIVDGANAVTFPSAEQLEMYNTAYDFLHPEVEEVNPLTKKVTKGRTDGPDLVAYNDNMDDYVTQISLYRAAYNSFLDEMSDPEGDRKKAQRDWQAKEPMLGNNIKKAFNKLTAGNGKYVEQALAILKTSINDGVRRALELSQENVAKERMNASSLGMGDWLLSYAMPENWETDEMLVNYTDFTINSENLKEHSDSTEHKFGLDTSFNSGLWKVSASASGERAESHRSMEGEKVEISAKIAKVSIMRPWFDESIFKVGGWFTNKGPNETATGFISNGKMDSSNRNSLIPMYPVAFIVARDITIKAELSKEEESMLKESYSAETSVGWGPFSIGGNYSYGHTDENFQSELQNGVIKVPGMQVIGWVSRIVPFSPVLSEKDGQAKLQAASN